MSKEHKEGKTGCIDGEVSQKHEGERLVAYMQQCPYSMGEARLVSYTLECTKSMIEDRLVAYMV
mgnify:CR=1 FL=1